MTRAGTFGAFAILNARGSPSPAQTNILMNGQPLGGSSRQFVDLSRIPLEAVERVEIVLGGAAVNVITRRPDFRGAASHLDAQMRSRGTQVERIDFAKKGNRLGGTLAWGRFRSDGFQVNSYAALDSFTGLLAYNFPALGEVEAEGTVWDGKAGDPRGTAVPLSQWDRTLERTPVSELSHTEENTKTGRFTHKRRWGPSAYTEATFFALQRQFRYFPLNAGPPDFLSRDSLVNTELRLTLSGGWTGGAGFQSDDQNLSGTSRHHDDHASAFLLHSRDWGPLSSIARLRLEHQDSYGTAVQPRLTLIAEPRPGFTLSANASRSRRIPSFLERFHRFGGIEGNPGLAPETSWTYDLGARLERPGVAVSFTGFYTRIENRIAGSSPTFLNAGLAEVRGVEAGLDWKWGKLSNETRFTTLDSRGNSPNHSGFVPLRLTPKTRLDSLFTWTPGPLWRIGLRVRLRDKQYDEDGDRGTLIPRRTLYDAEITRRVWNSEIWVRVVNATDVRDTSSAGFDPRSFGAFPGVNLVPQMPRSFWAGLTIRFTD